MEVACAPAHLWKFIYEPERQKLWMKGMLENRPTSEGPTRVGSTFHMRIKEGTKSADYDGEVTAYDPPKHLGIRFWGGTFPKGMKMRADYRLTDLGGRTRLDYVAEVDSEKKPPFLMRLLMPLFLLFGKLQLRSFMKTLKRLAEETVGKE
jgi:carbon monoxide dehydrogenase subunit G